MKKLIKGLFGNKDFITYFIYTALGIYVLLKYNNAIGVLLLSLGNTHLILDEIKNKKG